MTDTPNLQRSEWRQWRQFAVLAEELHFGRAAARLHMTQPALTQAIAALEAALGVRLFDRNRRRVALSVAGQALLPEVNELLRRAQTLPALARAAAHGESGRLRVAFVSTVGYGLLPPWVRRFRERWPRVALELVEATSDQQLEGLLRGEIDAGFLLHAPGSAPAGLARRSLTSEPLVLALPEAHPLAARARLSLRAVLDEPLVLFPRRILPEVHDAVLQLYRGAGRTPQVAQEAIQMQTIVNLVSAGLGLAWVLHSVRQFQRPGVVYRPLAMPAGQGVPLCETSLVWREGEANPALQRFIEAHRAQ
ncbi:LysR substrate-binding domain-containing protein [Hydrogenophaga sp. T2]|uniref:LysR substrate-binding domain-containing protein n=1 Tax=Hydrogenophaga sp. T2 TaxID=3132823 RepID=UPI003CF79D2D